MPAANRPEYMEFVARIRCVRKSKGVTQEELSLRLGKPQSFVSKVETCERRLDIIEAAHWCLALGVTLDQVLPAQLRKAVVKCLAQLERSDR
ncbi:MAG TPA: helix-turn-helix transcriptional regulator [Armatimonadota bacterium]|nr:helix-turn-helix transcriptional regulator [Armatimonadota bacterium]